MLVVPGLREFKTSLGYRARPRPKRGKKKLKPADNGKGDGAENDAQVGFPEAGTHFISATIAGMSACGPYAPGVPAHTGM